MKYPPVPSPATSVKYRQPVVRRAGLVVACTLAAVGAAACSSPASPAAGSPAASNSSPVDNSPTASVSSSASISPAHGKTAPIVTGSKGIVGLLTFNGSFRLSGATTQHASFQAFPGTTKPASSCARIGASGTPAAKGEQEFKIPAPPAGSEVYLTVEVANYHGPGVYGKTAIRAVGASVVVGSASYNPLAKQATVSATFKSDGSGTFAFSKAAGADSSGPTLSGTFSWTCSG